MKLITLLPTPQHTVTADIVQRQGSQCIAITVWSETKTFRAISVAESELDKDSCMMGRSSNTFFIAESNGKDVIVYIQGTGADRRIVRIDAELDVLKRLLRTSMNDYPQGKFLFNVDKTRAFYKGYNWLYGLTKKTINPTVYSTPIYELFVDTPSQSLKEIFPILNRAIPARIQKGLFFTENEVYWLDRPLDQIIKITDKFYGVAKEPSVAEILEKEAVQENKEPVNIMLPYRNEAKKWISTRNNQDIIPLLLRDIEENIAIPPATRIVTQNKMTHTTYGQYFIPTQGLYGKEMLNAQLVDSFKNRLADDYSLVMRGKGFEMLYTKSDVNAIYFRQRGDVSYICDTAPPVKESVQQPKVEPVQEVKPEPVAMTGEAYLNRRDNIFAVIDAALPVQETPVVENQVTISQPPLIASTTELDQWYVELFETPILYAAGNLDLAVTRLAMNRVAVVDLPAPYGQLLAWSDVTHDKNVAALELEDNQLVSFAAATFYCKDKRVYMTETHVRLNTETPKEIPTPKPPKEALQEAVAAALKEMSLVEVLGIVTASAA